MLWATILFIWELVGIDLEKAQEAGGNAGALIRAIKSPQAVPWVLLILVGYFAFKLRIEWRQSNENRRRVREAKMDYYSACFVALTAGILYFGQRISRIQFADFVRFDKGRSVFWGVLVSVGFTVSAMEFLHADAKLRREKFYRTIFTFVVGLPVLIWVFRSFNRSYVLIGLLVGTLMGVLMNLVSRAARERGDHYGSEKPTLPKK